MASDLELLDAWRGGDKAAGGELFERYFPILHAFFSEKTDAVEDLIQRTFLACVRAQERLQVRSTFRGYLLAIARNELYAHYRGKMSDPVGFDGSITSLRALEPSPPSVVGLHHEQRLIAHALRQLPLNLQLTLELHYWEDLSTSELAEVLGIPHGSAKTRLRRARELLKQTLQGRPEDGRIAESTVADLDRWVRSMRDKLASPPSALASTDDAD